MKKNQMCRLASVLLILVLLTTSIVGSTFAKYTTEGSASDTARVAKWGVEVTATGTAFAKEYDTDDTNAKATITKSVITATGTGVDDKKLVAPGTSGDLLTASIIGKPEVAVKVKTAATLNLEGWNIPAAGGSGTEVYCPIVITIDGAAYKMGATEDTANHVYATIATFEAAVESALTKNDTEAANQFAPNTDLATAYNHTVTWAWPFDAATGTYQTDEKDTALGKQTPAPTIEFSYTATVTQIN